MAARSRTNARPPEARSAAASMEASDACNRRAVSAGPPTSSTRGSSEGVGTRLSRADAVGLLEREDEHLAVADLARPRVLQDHVDHLIDAIVVHGDLELHLGNEVDRILGAAVDLGVPALPAEALGLDRRDAGDAGLAERLGDVVQDVRLDNRDHELHRRARVGRAARLIAGSPAGLS